MLPAFNSGYGAEVPLSSEQEWLNQAGIAYGGSDTLAVQIGSFTNYIVLPVPMSNTHPHSGSACSSTKRTLASG